MLCRVRCEDYDGTCDSHDILHPKCAAVVRFFGTGSCVTGIESDAGFTNPKFAAAHKIPLHFNTHLGGFVPAFWDTRS